MSVHPVYIISQIWIIPSLMQRYTNTMAEGCEESSPSCIEKFIMLKNPCLECEG